MRPEAHRCSPAKRGLLIVATVCWIGIGTASELAAQTIHHPLFHANLPTGEIGRTQLTRRPELAGVFQPVLLKVPDAAEISLAEGDGFHVAEQGGSLVSLQVGDTYRLRVSNIPHVYGDVYPTVELIDRLHPPAGKETRFPIPVHITQADLRLALAGKFVTRVIYVEDPQRALPVRDLPEQRYVDALAHEDPFQVAAAAGRPVAILRMGSLTPGTHGPSSMFLFGSPVFQRHPLTTPAPYKPSERPEPPAVVSPAPKVPAAEPAGQDESKPVDVPVEDTAPNDPGNPAESNELSPSDAPEAGDVPPAEPDDDDPFDLFDESTDSPDDTSDGGPDVDDDPFAEDI